MAWCEANGVDYILGLAGNTILRRLFDAAADVGAFAGNYEFSPGTFR